MAATPSEAIQAVMGAGFQWEADNTDELRRHLVATATSRDRIIRMGEDPKRVHLVGSPAIDGLDAIGPLDDAAYDALGRPEILFLLHPTGADEETEHDRGRRRVG